MLVTSMAIDGAWEPITLGFNSDLSLWGDGRATLRSHAMLLQLALWGTGSSSVLLISIGRPVRLWLHLPTQAATLALVSRRVPAVCATAALQHPTAAHIIGQWHRALAKLVPGAALPSTPGAAQCHCVLRTLQWVFIVVVPTAAVIAAECSLLRQQERQLSDRAAGWGAGAGASNGGGRPCSRRTASKGWGLVEHYAYMTLEAGGSGWGLPAVLLTAALCGASLVVAGSAAAGPDPAQPLPLPGHGTWVALVLCGKPCQVHCLGAASTARATVARMRKGEFTTPFPCLRAGCAGSAWAGLAYLVAPLLAAALRRPPSHLQVQAPVVSGRAAACSARCAALNTLGRLATLPPLVKLGPCCTLLLGWPAEHPEHSERRPVRDSTGQPMRGRSREPVRTGRGQLVRGSRGQGFQGGSGQAMRGCSMQPVCGGRGQLVRGGMVQQQRMRAGGLRRACCGPAGSCPRAERAERRRQLATAGRRAAGRGRTGEGVAHPGLQFVGGESGAPTGAGDCPEPAAPDQQRL